MSLQRTESTLLRHVMGDVTSLRANRPPTPRAQNVEPKPGVMLAVIPNHTDPQLASPTQREDVHTPPQGSDDPAEDVSDTNDDGVVDKSSEEQKRMSHASTGSSFTPRKLKTRIGPWVLGRSLGHGMSGRVRLAKHGETGQMSAVKIIGMRQAESMTTASVMDIQQRLRAGPQSREDKIPMVLKREITILKTINHPNVIRLYDVWENSGEIYICTELVGGGELYSYILEHDLDEFESARIFRQIISALQYCHRVQLCHRDLKPENILLDELCNVKIADFGMAAMHLGKPLSTSCGSPHYAAPEVCRGDFYQGSYADIWSVGVVLYVMLFGQLPFGYNCGPDNVPAIVHEVQTKPITFRSDVAVSEDAKDFIKRVLRRTPEHRMPIANMWNHPFLSFYDRFAKLPENADTWIGGPVPALSQKDCGEPLKDITEIDRNIVHSLCTLFGTNNEGHFVDSLLGPGACFEKVLYQNLKDFRVQQEQEQHFNSDAISLAPSDYHHAPLRPLQKSASRASLLGAGPPRTQSQFSIVIPGSRRPSTKSRTTHRTGGTDTTYDPYHSSRSQVVYDGNPYTTVNVGRGSSMASKATKSTGRSMPSKYTPTRAGRRTRQSVSSVWESTVASSMASFPSSPPAMAIPQDQQGRHRTLRHTAPLRRTATTSSIGSSASRATPLSGSRFARSSSYKRNVSFRRNGPLPPRPANPTSQSVGQAYLPTNQKRASKVVEIVEVRPMPEDVFSQGENPALPAVTDNCAHHDPYINALQPSSEFSQYIDDVWGPDPVPVASRGRGRDRQLNSDELRAAHGQSPIQPGTVSSLRQIYERPLPEPPFREPEALTRQRHYAQLLRQMREKERDVGEGMLEPAMQEIERLMRDNALRIVEENFQRRVASAPVQRQTPRAATAHVHRHVSEPTTQQQLFDAQVQGMTYDGPTIRFIPQSPRTPIVAQDNTPTRDNAGIASPNSRTIEPRVVPSRKESREQSDHYDSVGARGSANLSMLQTIEEDADQEVDDFDHHKRGSGGSRWKGWFNKGNRSSRSLEKDTPVPSLRHKISNQTLNPPRASSQTVRSVNHDFAANNAHHEVYYQDPANDTSARRLEQWQHEVRAAGQHGQAMPSGSFQGTAVSSEFPSRGEGYKAAAPTTVSFSQPRSFWGFLRRIGKQGDVNMAMIEPSEYSSVAVSSSRNSKHQFSSSGLSDPRLHGAKLPARKPDPYADFAMTTKTFFSAPQNFFAKLLNLKPSCRVMAFEVDRIRTMKEIRAIFRSWSTLGVHDIKVEKRNGRVWASLNEENVFKAKPMQIVVEVFAIVYTQDKADIRNARGMSVARMEAVKGLKEHFEQCADKVEEVCAARNILVRNSEKAKEMKRMLKQFRR